MDSVFDGQVTVRRCLLAAMIGCLLLAACQVETTSTVPTPSDSQSNNDPATPTESGELTLPSTPSETPLPTEVVATATATPTTTKESDGQANADVEFVRAVQAADGTWTFHVTVSHPDTGWEDYADGWDVVTLDGTVLKRQPGDVFTRLLLHPHENEQPFTRSQSGLLVPDGVTQVIVRAHDLVDGFGGGEVLVDLTAPSGQNFEIESQ